MIEARGDLLLLTDADLSAPIAEAQKLFAAIAAGADVAIGSRWKDSHTQTVRQPFYRQIAGRAFNLLLRSILSATASASFGTCCACAITLLVANTDT